MYNEDKTFCFALTPSVVDTAEGRAHFDRLVADIRANGMFGAKGYYTLRLNEDHGFSISTFKMRPHEGW